MNCVVRTLAPAAKNNKTDVQHHTKIYTGLTDTFKFSWLLLRGLIWTLSMQLSCSHCCMGRRKKKKRGKKKKKKKTLAGRGDDMNVEQEMCVYMWCVEPGGKKGVVVPMLCLGKALFPCASWKDCWGWWWWSAESRWWPSWVAPGLPGKPREAQLTSTFEVWLWKACQRTDPDLHQAGAKCQVYAQT